MANNNTINTGKATQGNFTITYQANGNNAAIPVIDGVEHPEMMFGYVSESDRIGCLKLIEDALKATGGDTYAAMRYMYNAARVAAKEIKPEEAVEVDGIEILIDYRNRKVYLNDNLLADLEDVEVELPHEAVRVMLLDRAKRELERRAEEERRYQNSYENPEWRSHWGMDDDDDPDDWDEPEDEPGDEWDEDDDLFGRI